MRSPADLIPGILRDGNRLNDRVSPDQIVVQKTQNEKEEERPHEKNRNEDQKSAPKPCGILRKTHFERLKVLDVVRGSRILTSLCLLRFQSHRIRTGEGISLGL